ncbi:MAG: NAD(+) diphosphatase [Deltaproteobacteria bacterium]|nr:NAD(+) diphosphatase [Deltaproteobacteria bacterium]
MKERLIPSAQAPSAKTEPAWWFVFAAHKMLVREEGESMSVPLVIDPASLGLAPVRERYLGTLAGRPCYCAEVPETDPVPPEMGFYGLRYLYERLDEPMLAIAMKAVHLTEWAEKSRYCGRCGREMAPSAKEMNALECPGCGMLVFPRISPAVIVLVEREGRLLLARSVRFTANFFSTLAGFVEPGETLEDAIHREIAEEVGIRVRNIRYFGSQAWPFPDSLMIGFTAEYESGEIQIDRTEIAEAGWFAPDGLPNLPGKISIARKLIDGFLERTLRGKAPGGSRAERRYEPGE